MNFKNLHQQVSPLLICNVWDVTSAKIAEQLNFKAIGTSSAAIAAMLGYRDGEEMDFSELEYIVKRIKNNTSIPLSVDLESGYGDNPSEIMSNIKRLISLGVVGINLEDSIIGKKRTLLPAGQFSKIISEIKNQCTKENINIFLNVRTDSFLLNQASPLSETKKRSKCYENAGADGIFIPGITQENDIKNVVQDTHLPINVMCMPDLPDFEVLTSLGVKRISMGNFLFDYMYNGVEMTINTILKQKSFTPIF